MTSDHTITKNVVNKLHGGICDSQPDLCSRFSQKLLELVIEDTCALLASLACEIHKAVRIFYYKDQVTKY
jgi:hypothetical protein